MRAVDFDAVVAFAEAARAGGAGHFVLVTAVGADAAAKVHYSRMKGQVERAVERIGFDGLDILQPGLLIGARKNMRPVEGFFQHLSPFFSPLLVASLDRYGGIPATTVAWAIVELVERGAAGVHRHENRSIRLLAGRD